MIAPSSTLLHSQPLDAIALASMIQSQIKALAELSLLDGAERNLSHSDWYFLLQSVVDRMQWLVAMLDHEVLETRCELHRQKNPTPEPQLRFKTGAVERQP